MCLEVSECADVGPVGWRKNDGVWAYVHKDGLRIELGEAVRVYRLLGVPDVIVRLVVLGIGVAGVLHHQGIPTLHGTTVRTPSGDVVVVGPSGVGKSTVTATMIQRGSQLVADDIAAFDGISVRPGFGRLKLWADSAQHLGFDPTAYARVHPDHDKLSVPSPVVRHAAPAKAIVVLTRGALGIELIEGTEALLILLANHRLPDIVGPDGAWLAACQTLVRTVPIYRLSLPGPLAEVGAAVSLVEALLRS